MGREEKREDQDVKFLEDQAGRGFEGITAEDFAIPFLRILQPLSPQVDEDRSEYVKGAKPGMFFNTVTNQLYGATVKVIPILYKKIWLEWLPNRGGLAGRHEPKSIEVDKSNFGKWRNEVGNLVQETHMFYCLLADHVDEGPIIFSMSSTGIKHARNWNTQIMMTKLPSGARAPYYSSVWEVSLAKNTNQSGIWFQVGDKKTLIQRARFITSQEFSEFVEPARKVLESLQVDYAQLEDHSEEEAAPESGEHKVPF